MKKKKLNIDYRIICGLPYAICVAYKMFSNFHFMSNISELLTLEISAQVFAFMNNYISFIDILIAIIPITLLLFEKESDFIRYYAKQYLIINLYIPIIYFLVFGLIVLLANYVYVLVIAIMLYALYSLLSLGLSLISILAIRKEEYTDFPIIKKFVAKYKE